ncbi:MAG: hypothetical protein JO326_07220 [Acetobacteraceae bacterium]|nr:hypothetical protein [Acetobacteraceae bacterium]
MPSFISVWPVIAEKGKASGMVSTRCHFGWTLQHVSIADKTALTASWSTSASLL